MFDNSQSNINISKVCDKPFISTYVYVTHP